MYCQNIDRHRMPSIDSKSHDVSRRQQTPTDGFFTGNEAVMVGHDPKREVKSMTLMTLMTGPN